MKRLAERGIFVSDVLYVLKHGFVYLDGVPALQQGRFKYEIESRTPNSGGRKVRLVVIPDAETYTIDSTAETVIRRLAIEKLLIPYDQGIDVLARSSVQTAETQPININATGQGYTLEAA